MRRVQTRPWALMEVCGGQTHSIVKNGLDQLLPEGVELVHGPGCPVCVTPLEMIDKAHAIARQPDVIFCSFGDMLRVPGSNGDLFTIKSEGGDVRIVYSPLDCLKIARANPDKRIVFFAIGFETTAPANAMLAWRAREEKMANVSLLVSHVLVPPALEAILISPENRVQGFLGPGHVCAVMGYSEYLANQRALQGADRRHGLRTARHPGRRADADSAAGRRARRRLKTSTRAFWIRLAICLRKT